MTQSASAIAAAVREGTLTAREAVEQALLRIEKSDPQINALQIVRTERALAEADAVDARPDRFSLPLAGVPITTKDNLQVAGEPMRDGSLGSDASPQLRDHEVIRRLRAAGAVIVAITRVPELCTFGATESEFGITRNPWDLSRTPGGSSGGAAASVASGMVPLAQGNDGMGSIRIPSACCGLVGIKPGLGVVPAEVGNGSWYDMAENGPLATTVQDCATALGVMADTPELGVIAQPGSVRIALSTKVPFPLAPLDAQWRAATIASGDAFRSAGHTVRQVKPPYRQSMVSAELARWFAGTEQDAQLLVDRSKLTRQNRGHARAGRLVLRVGGPRPSGRTRWQAHLEEFFADHDVFLTPTLAQPPIKAMAWSQRSWLTNMWVNSHYAPFCAPWNLAGWPAMAVPAGVHSNGTPLSVQLVTRPGGEALLLALAAQLEQLRPWPLTAEQSSRR